MQLVIPYHDKPSTTSTLVAEKFQKEHKDVLRAISNLECSKEFRERNFTLSSYKSLQNRSLPMYIMTRDGFTFLVMAFTGPLAAKFKEEYLTEFNRMELLLKAKAKPLLQTYSIRILSEPTKSVPRGYWSIFDKSHKIMFLVEKYVGSVNKYDLVDGSIGRRWSDYRKKQEWSVDPKDFTYQYEDNRGKQSCKCYHKSELDYFEDWLEDVYIPVYLPEYLVNKYTNERDVVMLDKVHAALPKIISKK